MTSRPQVTEAMVEAGVEELSNWPMPESANWPLCVEQIYLAMSQASPPPLPDEVERLREALDRALDFVVDVINEAAPGSIYHTNAVECHRVAGEALSLHKADRHE